MKSVLVAIPAWMMIGLSNPVYAVDKCEAVFGGMLKFQYETKEVMDVSRTAKVRTFTTSPTTTEDIQDAIAYSKNNGLKITVKGTNHSHGGHNRRHQDKIGKPQAIQLDMLRFNKIIRLDKENLEVTIQAGVIWKDLSIFLDREGLAAKTEQSSNIFSIGGSVATNIHGRDIHGPLANSIKEIKFIDGNGVERVVNRANDLQTFRALIGGYGGLGVITEVTLKVEKNYLYKAQSVQNVSVADYIDYIKTLSEKPDDRMNYVRVNISVKSAFTKMSYVEWVPISDESESPNWKGWQLNLVEKNRWVSSLIMNLMRYKPTSNFGKAVKDFMDKFFGLPKTGTHKTKNNILNNPVQFLFDNFYNQKRSVDILQEYFIPAEELQTFLFSLKNTTEKNQLDLMNVTMRYIPKIEREQDGLLSPYSDKQDLIAIVLYFNIQEDGNLNNGDLVEYNGSKWTQELISSAQKLGGTFYWPYHRWWSNEQITHNQKENIQKYFKIKDELDPLNIFESDFMHHLRRAQD
ncbi:MAG: FAD-binding oxidoreductase [Bdellovibrio sp.]